MISVRDALQIRFDPARINMALAWRAVQSRRPSAPVRRREFFFTARSGPLPQHCVPRRAGFGRIKADSMAEFRRVAFSDH